MKKRVLAALLALVMIFSALPMSVFADDLSDLEEVQIEQPEELPADKEELEELEEPEEEDEPEYGISTYDLVAGETQNIEYYILYVDDSFHLGYNYSSDDAELTTYTCQYREGHSGVNHSLLESDIKAAAERARKRVADGYTIVGWTKTAKADPTIYPFKSSGTTTTQTSYRIYLVAKKESQTFTLKYDTNGSDTKSWSETKTLAADSVTFTVTSTVPRKADYTFKGWQDGSGNMYNADDSVTVSKSDNYQKTLTAVWEEKQHEHKDDNGDGFCDDDGTCMHAHDENGYCTVEGCTHPHGDNGCCPLKPEEGPGTVTPKEDLLGKYVNVVCSTDNNHSKQLPIDELIENNCTVSLSIKDTSGKYHYTLTLYGNRVVDYYNTTYAAGNTHTAASAVSNSSWSWTWNGTAWVLDEATPMPTDGVLMTINVTCEDEPVIPELTKTEIASLVKVYLQHRGSDSCGQIVVGPAVSNNLNAFELTRQNDGSYKLTISGTIYLNNYEKSNNTVGGHVLDGDTTKELTLIYENDAWKVQGQEAGKLTSVFFYIKPVLNTFRLTYDPNAGRDTVTNMPNPNPDVQTGAGTTYTFTISSNVPEREGYEFVCWSTDEDGRGSEIQPGANFSTSDAEKTIYAIWKAEEIPEPTAIVGKSDVKVICLNPTADQPNCNESKYGVSLAFKRTLTKDETNKKHYTLELNAEIYANAYDGNRGPNNEKVAHNLYSSDTLTWDLYYEDGKWNAYPREEGVDDVVLVTHAPQKWQEVGKIASGTGVDATCVTSGKYAQYGLTAPFVYYGSDTKPYHDQVISVDYDKDMKSYIATFKADTFADSIAKACVNSQLTHKLTTKEELTWIFSVESVEGTKATWKAEPKTAADAKVTVQCLTDVNAYITPVTSDGEDSLLNAGIELDAQTLGRIGLTTYGDDGRILLGEFRSNTVAAADADDYFGDDDAAFVKAVVNDMLLDLVPAGGIDEDKLLDSGVLGGTDWTNVHVDDEDETYLNGKLKFYSVEFLPNAGSDTVENMPAAKYPVGALEYYDFYVEGEKIAAPTETPTREGYTFTGWYEMDASKPFDFENETVDHDIALCAMWKRNSYTVNLVIYRNGDFEKPYKTVALEPQAKGTVLDLGEYKIADYYDALGSAGTYDFYGWYNDGQWNVYKQNPDEAPDALSEITVNGWTNIIGMVYDYENIVVKAAYDDGTPEETLFTGAARKGANLLAYLKENVTDLEKTGYTHTEWYKADAPTILFSETDAVNGWTNVLVKYTRKSYNVVAKLYLNGEAVMKADGTSHYLSDAISGLYGETIDYSAIEAWAKDLVVNEIDKDNAPDAAATTVKIYKDGGTYDPSTTYGNPDVSTNYVWADVTTYYKVEFNTDGGSDVAAQTVKYGETLAAFEEPTKDGYKFLGWFDADGNEFDLNTPITKSMTLTAKWEKKSYVIASDLRINGSEANLADGKSYPWTYRYGDLYGETIDYAPMIAALKERTLAVDTANEPVDAEIKLCFPGTTDKLFNETVKTYGQEGGGWNAGNKNTAPIWGYATTYYKVEFESNGGSKIGEKIVKWNTSLAENDPIGSSLRPTKDEANFVGWFTEDGEEFDLSTPITKSMKLYAHWTNATPVNPNMPVYAYFKAVDKDGNALTLNAATLERVKLTYNAGGKYFTYGSFETAATFQGDSYDKDSDEMAAVLKDMATGLERFDTNKDFAGSASIDWTSLVKVNAVHKDYTTEAVEAYHLNGALKFYNVTFAANEPEGAAVENMPEDGQYYDGEQLLVIKTPFCAGYNFAGWDISEDFNGTVTSDLTFTAKWTEATPVNPNMPVYAYFKAVDKDGKDLTLTEATLERIELTYNAGGKYFTYGTFETPAVLQGESYDKESEELKAVLEDLDGISRFETNKDFAGGSSIDWTSLVKVNAAHKDYTTEAVEAYHLNGTLKFFNVTFVANAPEGAAVENMPEDGQYYDGEQLLVIKTPFCAGYNFAGWEISDEAFDGTVKSDLTFTAKWEAATAVETKTPVYVFFKPVDSEGNDIKSLDAATLERLDLSYNSAAKDWFTLGKLNTEAALSVVADTAYDKDSDEFKTVTSELSTEAFARLAANENFEGMQSINWATLKNVNTEHYGYDISGWGYHLDGTLEFYNVTFDKNTDDEVSNMPESGLYYEGEALPNGIAPSRDGWFFAGWYDDAACTTAHDFGDGTATKDMTVYAKWVSGFGPIVVDYKLTIECVTKSGKVLDTETHYVTTGAEYSYNTPKIKNYTTKTKKVEGTMPGHDLTIEVVYMRKSSGSSSSTVSPNKPKKDTSLKLNTSDHLAYIAGYPDGSVQPEGNVTRAETAAILYRIMDADCVDEYKTTRSSFSDVARGDWYNTYVATLENAGVIVDTRTNGKFRPNDAITRAELATMIAQFADVSATSSSFTDVSKSYWAAEEIATAAKMGWINGYPDGSFRPDRTVTRAELMAMVNRALGRTPKSEDDLLSGMKKWRDNSDVDAWYYLDVQEATNDHTYTKSGTHESWKKLI